MHDIKQPEKQMALRADLQKTKFTIEMSCLQMLKTMLDALSLILGSFTNFFGNASDGDGETLSQEVYDEIARASAAAAELAFEVAANQVTPQPSSRMPNPALTPLPPVTPIVSTSLSELRAARTAESGGGITSSKGASKSSKDDDGKTSTELVTEAISKGLKQDRMLRAKTNANKESTLWWLLTQIKDLLIKFGIGNLTAWQVTTILLGTYFLWPKLKPNMRLLLNRMHLQVLSARDMIVWPGITTGRAKTRPVASGCSHMNVSCRPHVISRALTGPTVSAGVGASPGIDARGRDSHGRRSARGWPEVGPH
eukprot:scaffold26403_cov95-Phaeocystis_antarctica.AAC.2